MLHSLASNMNARIMAIEVQAQHAHLAASSVKGAATTRKLESDFQRSPQTRQHELTTHAGLAVVPYLNLETLVKLRLCCCVVGLSLRSFIVFC